MKNILQFAASALTFAPLGALAWGSLGHHTVGYVAMEFISANTLSNVKSILGSKFSESLGPAASWADEVRSTYPWASKFHFIDANDSPPDTCSVSVSRDCGSGCIIGAIQNYTTRLLDTDLSATQRQQALLFVTHFIGDIGQPLHVEAYKVGGNSIDVTCDGDSTNLHHVWDTSMVEKSVNARFSGSEEDYATALANKIKTGSYKSAASGWKTCITASALKGTSCPLVWATEANKYDCSNVFDYTDGDDLCTGSYYTSAMTVIDEQIAKQGYRLAAWLDAVFDSL
ncbi:nuclease Le1 [Amylostereum chailletii]|nr:nuclease Le1 [Amylostereum chailletii]